MADLLPANATPQERALSESTGRIESIPVPVDTVWNPWTCPVSLLPWLAWALSVDEWSSEWTEQQQRQVVADSIGIHRKKGTRGAIDRALNSLGYRLEAVEWFEDNPVAEPGTFRIRVEIDGRGLNDSVQNEIERVVDASKNVRSHLTEISMVGKSSAGSLHFAAYPSTSEKIQIYPYTVTEADGPPMLTFSAMSIDIREKVNVEAIR